MDLKRIVYLCNFFFGLKIIFKFVEKKIDKKKQDTVRRDKSTVVITLILVDTSDDKRIGEVQLKSAE